MKNLLVVTFSVSFLFLGCKQDVSFEPGNGSADVSGTDPFEIEDPTGYQGPTIVFTELPQDALEGEDVQARFEIYAGDLEIDWVRCAVDNIVVPCNPVGDLIVVTAPALGPHTIEVLAADTSEVVTRKSVGFTIHDQMQRQKQLVQVNAAQKKPTDIIFVIDNSGSMAQEQVDMGAKILSFMELIENLDWRVAITTTDPRSSQSTGDGALLPFSDGSFYLESSMDLDDAKAMFAETIETGTRGSGYERGIRSLYRTIERNNAGEAQVQSFFRPDAALSVIVVSDEDETLADGNGNAWADLAMSDGDNLVNLVRSTWGQEKLFQFSSIITRPGDDQCLQPVGTGYRYGTRYEEVSLANGGVVGDICAQDFGLELAELGQVVSDLETVYELSCVPQDLNRDGKIDFDIQPVNGQPVPTYQIDGKKITFDQALEPGDYNFVYFCLNTVST